MKARHSESFSSVKRASIGGLKEEKNMVALCFLLIALIVLDIAALQRGANSSDGINSPEWERRQNWPGFH